VARDSRESFATRLYRGQVSYDFIARRRRWYVGSGVVLLIGILSLAIQGINPSIDFKGGAQFQGPLNGHSITQVRTAITSAGVVPEVAVTTGSGSDQRFQVETTTLTNSQVERVETALVSTVGLPSTSSVDVNTVGATWGSQITHKAIISLVVFLIAVVIYLSVRYEWKMAVAAIAALVHDLVITAGIYSLSGLSVSPSTVIALLTILGYSLYDTVVVFDKVRENTSDILGGSRYTFSQASNLAVNQTLVRSINTSVIALLPVAGLLIIGAGLLGAGSLKDLALALLIGLASGAYSSIFIATPILCDLKEREPAYQRLAARVSQRRARERQPSEPLQPATVGAPLTTTEVAAEPPMAGAPDASLPGTAADASSPAGRPARPATRPARRGGRPGGRGAKSRRRR
jgi:preprotein translocase subunit SecF